jgi:hypothetical protein
LDQTLENMSMNGQADKNDIVTLLKYQCPYSLILKRTYSCLLVHQEAKKAEVVSKYNITTTFE